MKVKEDRSVELGKQIALAERMLEERRLAEAVAAFDLAEAMGADANGCAAARWTAAMLCGDFEAAWRESDGIRQRGTADPHRFWMGEDVRGARVMVRCLHGFGDAIQFLRYMPRLQALAKQVIVEVPPRMVSLAPLLDGVGEVVTWGEMAPGTPPDWEVQIEVMELPYLFRTGAVELPLAVEYLRVLTGDLNEAARVMGPARGFRVGLVWAAGEWNVARSIPFEFIECLARSGDAEFWSLQGGEACGEAAALVSEGILRDAGECGDGLRVLAAVIANLDLVITVDTLAGHLAGAMGKPVWLLLQHAADWRWMTDRCDSQWYPNTRLFRQPSEGDWSGVVEEVRTELAAMVNGALVSEVAS